MFAQGMQQGIPSVRQLPMLCSRALLRALCTRPPASKLAALQESLRDGPSLQTFLGAGVGPTAPPTLPSQMTVPAPTGGGEPRAVHRSVPVQGAPQ